MVDVLTLVDFDLLPPLSHRPRLSSSSSSPITRPIIINFESGLAASLQHKLLTLKSRKLTLEAGLKRFKPRKYAFKIKGTFLLFIDFWQSCVNSYISDALSKKLKM